MVSDIVYSFILVWVLGITDLSFSFNSEKSGPVEADVGAERGGLIFFCE